MVASIKFWMKAFCILDKKGELSHIADKLLADGTGYDPYFEDLGSLWLLHFNIINTYYATAYRTTFIDYHRRRNVVEKDVLKNYIKSFCFENKLYRNLYNENTIKKDINVLIHNYCTSGISNVEDTNTIFAPLNLIVKNDNGAYMFNYDSRPIVPADIFLYSLLIAFPDSRSISFEDMRDLSLMFCLTNNDLLTIINQLCDYYPGAIVFSDVAGIKELQIKDEISVDDALENYYINH